MGDGLLVLDSWFYPCGFLEMNFSEWIPDSSFFSGIHDSKSVILHYNAQYPGFHKQTFLGIPESPLPDMKRAMDCGLY